MTDHAKADEQAVSDHADRRASDRRRAAKLRERREQAGQVRISAWVPRERAAHARQVLRAAAAGDNTLPSDPEQQAALDAARAEAAAARAELEAAREAGRQASAEAAAQAKAAERAQAALADELRVAEAAAAAARAGADALQERAGAAQEATDALRGELEGVRGKRGWRRVLLRLAGVAAPRGRQGA